MAAEGLEERLEASGHEAAHNWTVDLDIADARSPLEFLHRRRPDTSEFDPLGRLLCSHV